MKRLTDLYPGVALVVVLLCSCGNGAPDSVKDAKEANASKIDSQKTMEKPPDSAAMLLSKADADFLVNAASKGRMEAELGRLAETRSRNPRVRALASMIVKDHTEKEEKLKELASSKHIVLPDSVSNRQQKKIDDMQKKKGVDFDKAYVSTTVGNNKDDIDEFEKQAKKGIPEIAAFALYSLPMLHKHLDSAEVLRKMMGLAQIVGTPPPYVN